MRLAYCLKVAVSTRRQILTFNPLIYHLAFFGGEILLIVIFRRLASSASINQRRLLSVAHGCRELCVFVTCVLHIGHIGCFVAT